MQLIAWSEQVVKQLVEEGHFVIVFDNRDTGLSSKMEEAGIPDVIGIIAASMRGEEVKVPYTFYDMGDDAVGLLDAMGIEKAHIAGMSMGGAIAQTIDISHPERLLSLTLIYAPTGNPNLPQPNPEIGKLLTALMTPPIKDRETFVEITMNWHRTVSGSGFPLDEEGLRQGAARAYDRSYYPEGLARQLLSGRVRRNRRSALPSVTASTLVIHGDEDPAVLVENVKDAAETIPGAELVIIKGMGHYPPHGGPWPQIVKVISAHTRKVQV